MSTVYCPLEEARAERQDSWILYAKGKKVKKQNPTLGNVWKKTASWLELTGATAAKRNVGEGRGGLKTDFCNKLDKKLRQKILFTIA